MMRLPLIVALMTLSSTSAVAFAPPEIDGPLPDVDMRGALPTLDADALDLGVSAMEPEETPRRLDVRAPGLALPGLFVDKSLLLRNPFAPERPSVPMHQALSFLLLPDGELVTDGAGEVTARPGRASTSGPLGGGDAVATSLPRVDALDAAATPELSPGRTAPAPHRLAAAAPTAAATTSGARVADGPAGDAPVALVVAGSVAAGLLGLLGLALYHRIRPSATLENDTRKTIFEAVCARPGLGVHELADAANVSYSTATYHLERLVAAGMLVMTPDGNKLCYYKNGGAFTESERRLIPILKNQEAARLLEAILEEPGTYRAALAQKLGVTATTINWHLRRLREAGIIHEVRQGRNAYLHARVDQLGATLRGLGPKLDGEASDVGARLLRYAPRPAPAPDASGMASSS